MDKADIELNDWSRILTGDAPGIFIVETVIRAFFLYVLLMVALRLMGKRMANRMTRNELAGVATLAAAIGMPMQTPDRGLLPAFLIVALVVTVQRLLAAKTSHDRKFEKAFLGKLSTVVKDGVLQLEELRKPLISRDRILSVLRSESVIHLGQVKRLYLEESGAFSLLKQKEEKPGMSILPEWDEDFINEQCSQDEIRVCTYCGMEKKEGTPCPQCGNIETVRGIKTKPKNK